MQYYPVIYTRTRCCDYFAGFHVRPDFIVPAEVLPYIRTATKIGRASCRERV